MMRCCKTQYMLAVGTAYEMCGEDGEIAQDKSEKGLGERQRNALKEHREMRHVATLMVALVLVK